MGLDELSPFSGKKSLFLVDQTARFQTTLSLVWLDFFQIFNTPNCFNFILEGPKDGCSADLRFLHAKPKKNCTKIRKKNQKAFEAPKMASNNRSAFSPRTPHFFKIIFQETLQDNKLRIPHKFVRKYGETLSNKVTVKLPCGLEWKMRLLKRDGKVWLKLGWPEFVKQNSIQRGNLLVFRYEGNSKFHIVICDTTAVEIDYRCGPAQVNECQLPEREVDEDDFLEVLDDLSSRLKRAEKIPVPPCSQHHKRMRAGSKTQSNSTHPKPEGSNKTVFEKPSKRGSRNSKQKAKRKQCGLNPTERAGILERAPFKSRKPFFKVVMQPSYINGGSACYLPVPRHFATRYFENYEDDVLLLVPKARSWSAQLRKSAKIREFGPRMSAGWKAFAADNNLQVGDVCVFELVNRIEISFQVSIFRAADDKTNLRSSQAGGSLDGESKQVKVETD